MPADLQPVVAVPRRMRQICAAVAAVVLVAMLADALLLRRTDRAGLSLGVPDQVAIALLGVVLAAGILLLGQSRVEGDAAGVRVRNILVTHTLPWEAVQAVRFDRKSAWASLQLTSGDALAVLAVQAIDRERAVAAVEGLRRLHGAHGAEAGRAADHRE